MVLFLIKFGFFVIIFLMIVFIGVFLILVKLKREKKKLIYDKICFNVWKYLEWINFVKNNYDDNNVSLLIFYKIIMWE